MAMKDRFDTSVASLFWEGDWCHLSTQLEEVKMVMISNIEKCVDDDIDGMINGNQCRFLI